MTNSSAGPKFNTVPVRSGIALAKPPPRPRSSTRPLLELARPSPHLLLHRPHLSLPSFVPPLALQRHAHLIAKDKAAVEQDRAACQLINTVNSTRTWTLLFTLGAGKTRGRIAGAIFPFGICLFGLARRGQLDLVPLMARRGYF